MIDLEAYGGATISSSSFRSSQSSAKATIALSGREPRIREARINSPRICANIRKLKGKLNHELLLCLPCRDHL